MRKEIIYRFLEGISSVRSIVFKYDYYIEGKISLENNTTSSTMFFMVFSEDEILFNTLNDLKLWNVKTNNITYFKNIRDIVYLKLLPNRRIVISTYNQHLQIWSLDDPESPQHEFNPNVGIILGLYLLPNNNLIIYGLYGNVKIWDLKDSIIPLKGHTRGVNCLCLLPNGDLVSGSFDETIRIWDLLSGICKFVLKGHTESIDTVNIIKDKFICSSSSDGTIRICDNEVCIKVIKVINDNSYIKKILISEIKIISIYTHESSHDNDIKIWDSETGICESILTGHKNFIDDIQLLPNNDLLSKSKDSFIIWDLYSYLPINSWETQSDESHFGILSSGKIISTHADSLVVWE